MAVQASHSLLPSFLLPPEPVDRLLYRPEAAACAALSPIHPSAPSPLSVQQRKYPRRMQICCMAVMVQRERSDVAMDAEARRYCSSAAVAVAAAVAGYSIGLVAENESNLLENAVDRSKLGQELETLTQKLMALERSVLEAQWSSLEVEEAWREDVASPFGNVEQNSRVCVNAREEESSAGAVMETVKSGRPSARQRRLKARQEGGVGYERPQPLFPKHRPVDVRIGQAEKRARGRGKVLRRFQAFFLRDTAKKQLTEGEQRILWDRMRSARLLIEGKKRLCKQLGSEPSEGMWASYLSISEQELVTTLRDSKVAQSKLVNANLRLVVSIARRYQNLGMDLADLIQEGTSGLVRGVEKFDSTRGFKFSTYAHWWILQGITRGLAKMSRAIRLPYHLHETVCRIRKIQTVELGLESDTLEKLSKTLKLPCARVELAIQASKYRLKSLDASLSCNNDATRDTLHHVFADSQKENRPWSALETANAKENFEKYITAHLQPREREIIQIRYGLNQQYVYPVTRENIGDVCGLSRERVRQLERVAICKLKSSKKELNVENLNLASVR